MSNQKEFTISTSVINFPDKATKIRKMLNFVDYQINKGNGDLIDQFKLTVTEFKENFMTDCEINKDQCNEEELEFYNLIHS